VRLLPEAVPWPHSGRVRRAGVSSFGISGTNVHVILEEAPPRATAEAVERAASWDVPLVVSGPTEAGLRANSARLAEWLDAKSVKAGERPARRIEDGVSLVDVAYSLATTRTAFRERASIPAADVPAAIAGLRAVAEGGLPKGAARATARCRRTVFVFPGQGSQHVGMCRGLLDEPVFAEALAECDVVIRAHTGMSVVALLNATEAEQREALEKVDVVQPLLFAVAVALARLWRSYGVTPDAVVGHSQGEVAAAVVAGALSLEDGARIVGLRSRLIRDLAGAGAMASIALPVDAVQALCEKHEGVSVAVVNTADSTVVAGDEGRIEALLAELGARGVFCRRIAVSYASHSSQVDPILADIREGLRALTPREAPTRFYSTVRGEALSGAELDGAYWADNLRMPVRMDLALAALDERETTLLIEVSAHPILVGPLGLGGHDAVVGTLHRDDDAASAMRRAVGHVHAHGIPVDWEAVYRAGGAARVELPTYAFQREPYWVEAPKPGAADASSLGLEQSDHAVLRTWTELADGSALFSGRLDLSSHAWLGDHRVFETVVVPGVGVLELALHAAIELGLDGVREVVLTAPIALAPGEARSAHLVVAPPAAGGTRPFTLRSRPVGAHASRSWTEHASGVLGGSDAIDPAAVGAWPPSGARELDPTSVYERLEATGMTYGPSFRGLRRVWQPADASALYVEAALPESVGRGEKDSFCIHPALFDSVLHGLAAAGTDSNADGARLPFEWRDVRIFAMGAKAVRARIARDGEDARIELYDLAGSLVATVGALRTRAATAAQIAAARAHTHLYRVTTTAVEWTREARAIVEGATTRPQAADPTATVVVRWPTAGGGTSARVHEIIQEGVAWLQRWLRMESGSPVRVVWLTRGALALEDTAAPSVAGAALWGLGRSFQLEHPDHELVLIDADEEGIGDLERLPEGEPQLAIRRGQLFALRLEEVRDASISPADASGDRRLRADGTVVLTGATGGLGRVLAKHLVEEHGVRHLLLLSRSGASAAGVADWVDELKAAGAATVAVRACDAADRDALASVLGEIPRGHPLTGVFHLAATHDDAMLSDLTAARVDAVLRAKVDAAFHLDELTRDVDLAVFALFSSAAGTLGSAAQTAYAAANAALDALAVRRRRMGLAAKSLAWGSWAEVGHAARLDPVLRERIRRSGTVPFDPAAALVALDAALAHPEPVLAPLHFDRAALDRAASEGMGLPLLRNLSRPSSRAARAMARSAGSALVARLGGLPESERCELVLATARAEIATVLGLRGPEAVPVDRPLRELGLDSLLALEIRNRLSASLGTKLPASLLFDHPTATDLARFLETKLVRGGSGAARAAATARVDVDEPIAIIAMSARYPGGVQSPEDLWSLVEGRVDAMTEFPERPGWDGLALYDPDPSAAGRSYVREGGFLHDAALFDPGFFHISPREAPSIDPQQRLLLEAAWETIERAGIVPSALERSLTGVYVGVMYEGYGTGAGVEDLDGYAVTGLTQSTASGRIAYTLGLQGPALSIDTACSSSLVAVHLAMQGLRRGECDLALAGGVTVMSLPGAFVEFSRQRGLAKDGRCKPFSDDADGMAIGEGCGLVLLERLSDARRNGRRILAVLRGSAVNQDGKSQGFTAPNGPSQERVILQALSSAGLSLSDVDAVEAHGTGTTIGDPIEAGALLATYGQAHTADAPLHVGAIKSNIGHAQAAAGVAGLIKMVKALEHETLPPSLHAGKPTRHVDWTQGHLRLLSEPVPWPRGARVRRAGVSSFGISGTNAHVIVEEAPVAPTEAPVESAATWAVPLVVSGASDDALRANSARLADRLERGARLVDVGYSLATTRTAFRERAAISAADVASAIEGLRAVADGELPRGGVRTTARCQRTVFVFPGQGSQHVGMCRGLLGQRAFVEALTECDEAIRRHAGMSVASLLHETDERQREAFEDVGVVQPTLFAVAVALARLWRSYGVTPDAVIGHSQGEVAAAVVAGALSVDDGARIVCLRSRLIRELGGKGAMASVALPVDAVLPLLAERGGLSVAVVNTAESTVVAGDEAQIESLVSELGARGVFCRRIAVSYASHSSQVDPILGEIRAGLGALTPRDTTTKLHSTVRGAALGGAELDGAYWADNLRMPVRMDLALASLGEEETTLLLEVSAHPILVGPLTMAGREAVVGTLHREEDAGSAMRRSAGQVYAHGIAVDWEPVYAGSGARRVELPTYAFQREPYWLAASPRSAGDTSSLGASESGHAILHTWTELPDGSALFAGRLGLASHPWLADHTVFGAVLVPGGAVLDLVLHAATQLGIDVVREIVLAAPLVLEAAAPRTVHLAIAPAGDDGTRAFTLSTRSADAGATAPWTEQATGVLGGGAGSSEAPLAVAWPPPDAKEIDLLDPYERLVAMGIAYGAAFRGLRRVWQGPEEGIFYVEAALPDGLTAAGAHDFGLHPVLIDSVLQGAFAATAGSNPEGVHLPFEWRDVRLFAGGVTAVRARLARQSDGGLCIQIHDTTGVPVATVGALRTRAATVGQIAGARSAQATPEHLRGARTKKRLPSAAAARLALVPESERPAFLLEAVRAEIALVLGVPRPEGVPVDQPLQELGLTSLMAVEIRNRLATLVGAKLPATLVFDHPTVKKLAGRLLQIRDPERDTSQGPVDDAAISAAVGLLERMSWAELEQRGMGQRLRHLLSSARAQDKSEPVLTAETVAEIPMEGLLDLIDTQLSGTAWAAKGPAAKVPPKR
ncbi:MAG: SDR family NAD(P)-dependent oxidoreductase, partial [Polyangiaceae bacterium]|nr:SDR family NAD(P)-dependent oxidoreductase [Polyangiaceae bacterium]